MPRYVNTTTGAVREVSGRAPGYPYVLEADVEPKPADSGPAPRKRARTAKPAEPEPTQEPTQEPPDE